MRRGTVVACLESQSFSSSELFVVFYFICLFASCDASDQEAILSLIFEILRFTYLKDISIRQCPELVGEPLTLPSLCATSCHMHRITCM